MSPQVKNPAFVIATLGDMEGLTDAAKGLLRQAFEAINRYDFRTAEQVLILCLAHAPKHPEPNRLLGIVYQRLGRTEQAIACLREALKSRPADVSIVIPLMQALADTGDIDAAIDGLRELVSKHENTITLGALAEMLGRHGFRDEAISVAERVLALDPAQTRTRLHYALNLFHGGYINQAGAQFRGLIRDGHEVAGAWYGLAEMKSSAFDGDDLDVLRKLCADERASGQKRAMLLHALGKACEDNRDLAAAFAAYSQSAAISRAAIPWNLQFVIDQLAELRSAFPDPGSTITPDFGNEVIFIVGMPRSGSSLTEHILAAHLQVEGGSELLDLPFVLKQESRRQGLRYPTWVKHASRDDWRRLGEAYLARTRRWRANKPRFTDKYPANWMAAELALTMLPGARIIECRRDPLEMLWSCYKQHFAPGSAPWSYDFNDLVDYWKVCTEYCDYLAARYPDRVRIQSYERLLDDPEQQTRELLAFCGLEFDPACLRSHEGKRMVRTPSAAQVRKPIARRASASELYGALLDPLRQRLKIG